MNFLLLPPQAANSGRKLLALSGYPNGCRSAFCLSPLYTMNAFALMSCVWVLSLARFVYSLVKGVIMSNSGKLWHLSVGVFECTRVCVCARSDCVFPEHCCFVLFVFCFSLIRMRLPAAAEVFFSKELWCLKARVRLRAIACQDMDCGHVCRRGASCLCVCVFMHA